MFDVPLTVFLSAQNAIAVKLQSLITIDNIWDVMQSALQYPESGASSFIEGLLMEKQI